MSATATLSITLSDEEFNFIQERVAAGEFSSESEVVATGLHRLREETGERKRWEQDVLLPRLSRMATDPSERFSTGQVIEHLSNSARTGSR